MPTLLKLSEELANSKRFTEALESGDKKTIVACFVDLGFLVFSTTKYKMLRTALMHHNDDKMLARDFLINVQLPDNFNMDFKLY